MQPLLKKPTTRRPSMAKISGMFIFGLALSFALYSADQSTIPDDELGILRDGVPESVHDDTQALAGTWGKCLKSVDTRCYFMRLEPTGAASILTYISTREKQFADDPADKPHCYSRTDRKLKRLGEYTYIWEDHLAANTLVDKSRLMKIVVADDTLMVYTDDKLQLSLPAVSNKKNAELSVC